MISLILILFLLIGTVSASEINETQISSDNNGEIVSLNDNDGVLNQQYENNHNPLSKNPSSITIEVNPQFEIGEDIIINLYPVNSTGNITVQVNGNSYPVFKNTVNITGGLPGGKYTVIAILAGDESYGPSFANATFEVVKIKDVPMNVTIPEGIKAREYFTIKVDLVKDATGFVFVDVADLGFYGLIKNGSAYINIPGLNAGMNNIIVKYDGNKIYASKVMKFDYNVSMATSAVEIQLNEVYSSGEDIIINITPINSTGKVHVSINGKNYDVVDNEVVISGGLADGNYTVIANLDGDSNFYKSNNTTAFIVKTIIKLNAPEVIKYYHGPERFVITVTDEKNKGIANKTVFVKINGVTYTKITDNNGETSIGLNLNPGTYNITATCDEITVNSYATILTTVYGKDIVKMFRNGTQYYGTFLDSNGDFLSDGSDVEFNINGIIYYRKVSGNEGQARLNINLSPGDYIITAKNPNTGEMSSNNIKVLPKIIENYDLVKYYKNDSQYTVKVLGNDGKAVGANETVIFNINGVLYKRMTNESGIARLNINLGPGNYLITAEYGAFMVSNSITVLPILSADDLNMYYKDGSKFEAKLVDGKGNDFPYQNVTFNINGVLYNRPTDFEGIARLNINLQAGEYIITSSYNGFSISNIITIKVKEWI